MSYWILFNHFLWTFRVKSPGMENLTNWVLTSLAWKPSELRSLPCVRSFARPASDRCLVYWPSTVMVRGDLKVLGYGSTRSHFHMYNVYTLPCRSLHLNMPLFRLWIKMRIKERVALLQLVLLFWFFGVLFSGWILLIYIVCSYVIC